MTRPLAVVLPHRLYNPAVSRPARLLLCKPLPNSADCPRVRTRGLVYRRSGNAYTVVSDPNVNINEHWYFRPPSFAALPTSAAAAPSLELALPTTAPDSNSALQVFYTTQEIEAHSLKDLELTVPRMPTVHSAPPS